MSNDRIEHETQELLVNLSYAEQAQIIKEHEIVIANAADMLKRQKKIIEDLKMFYEKLLMDYSELEIRNLQLQGKLNE